MNSTMMPPVTSSFLFTESEDLDGFVRVDKVTASVSLTPPNTPANLVFTRSTKATCGLYAGGRVSIAHRGRVQTLIVEYAMRTLGELRTWLSCKFDIPVENVAILHQKGPHGEGGKLIHAISDLWVDCTAEDEGGLVRIEVRKASDTELPLPQETCISVGEARPSIFDDFDRSRFRPIETNTFVYASLNGKAEIKLPLELSLQSDTYSLFTKWLCHKFGCDHSSTTITLKGGVPATLENIVLRYYRSQKLCFDLNSSS